MAVLFVVASASFISCDDEETYAEQKEREARQIDNWISQHNINVVSMTEFLRDTITDVARNEYVLFSDNGVYMQIVKRGGAVPSNRVSSCTITPGLLRFALVMATLFS